MAEANSINAATTGIVGNTGTAFTATAVTNHGVVLGGATSSTLGNVGPTATSGQVLQSAGSSADPAFSTATYPATATGTGKILRADGTNWVATTATYPDTAGTSGNVLTSDGTNWTSAALPGSSGFTSVVVQTFTASGTYTPTANMKYCIIQALGGGGGGGGAAATGATTAAIGSGGGAGEFAVGIFSAATIGASKAVTIGTAGTGASGTTGNAGGNTSVGSTLISANGGSGGAQSGTVTGTTIGTAAPGAGGTGGTGGNYRTPGMVGTAGMCLPSISSTICISGVGANSQIGSGGTPVLTFSANGNNAAGYGAGGSGASGLNTTAKTGGSGTAGIVIVTEYI